MSAAEVWNVFLPKKLLNHSSVYLIGQIDQVKCSIFVTDICYTYVTRECESVVGYLTSSATPQNQNLHDHVSAEFLVLNVRVNVSVIKQSPVTPECKVFISGKDDSCKCVCIVLDPPDILSSFILNDEYDNYTNTDSHLGRLIRVYDKKKRPSLECIGHILLERVFTWFLWFMTKFFSVMNRLLSVVSFRWCWSRLCVQFPAVLSHTAFKLNRFNKVQSMSETPMKSRLILFDVCGQQLLDTVLGVVVMVCVMNSNWADIVASSILQWADDIASYLSSLLHWLMGAPAGLKLNTQLTECMGHFFLYHVYLWSGYLSVLRPVLSWVLWIASCFGMLGLSTQLCLVQDIVSMLTLHIYCFYVYAARVYSLQTYALSSLWRLFRGKKWNVLRQRVDSALYNIDQLCVGTLLFTVLLFLLPTTLLYYVVFTALRLVVLTVHGLLTFVIDSLSIIPAVTIILRICKSKFVAGDLLFTVIEDIDCTSKPNCTVLCLQTTQLPMQTLCHRAQAYMTARPHRVQQQQYSWGELLSKLVSGSLLYPWVSPYDTSHSNKEFEAS